MTDQPDTFYAKRDAHQPMTCVVKVLGDCGAVHGSVEDWQNCPVCERYGNLKRHGMWHRETFGAFKEIAPT